MAVSGPQPRSVFAHAILQWRWGVLVCLLGVIGVSASGGRFLAFSTDYRVFFSKDNPQLNAFEALQNTYTKNDNVLIGIEPKSGDVFTGGTLQAVREVTEAAWQIPYSIRVDSITNFQHTRAEEDDLIVEDLVRAPERLTADDLGRIKNIALAEPLINGRLLNPQATLTAVNVTINLPGKANEETPEVVNHVRGMVERFRAQYPDLNFYMTGVVFMNNAFDEAGRGDMMTLIPVMYTLVLVLLWWLLRSFFSMLATILVVVFSVLTGMGLAGWVGILLTPIAANAPIIILTLGVADSIHILTTMLHEMRTGKSKRDALAESLRVNHQPVFITSLTTAIGFLSLNFSDSPPFRDLGNIVAIGVMAAYVYSVTLLPILMSLFPVKVKALPETGRLPIDWLADRVIANRRAWFYGMLTVMVLLVSMTPRIEIDERFNEYFDERFAFRTDNDYIVEHLTGFESIEYSLSAGESGGIADPEFLKTVDRFAGWYRQQPHVMWVGTLTDIMQRLNKNMHGDDPAWYRLPDRRDLAAQYLLLYELSLPFGLDLNNQVNVDKSALRFTAVVDSVSTREALDLERRAQDWLKENAPASMQVPGSSPLIMFSHIARRNVEAMMDGAFLALALITAIMAFALRSVKFGLISIVPNLMPIAMTFGIWGLAFVYVGLSISVVAPVAFGIIVDDTVHFLSKYLRARRERSASPMEAVRHSFHTVGTALGITSFVLAAGFLVLSYSGFTMNFHLGVLTVIAIACALAADFLFLPPLLMKLEETRHENVSRDVDKPDVAGPGLASGG